MKQKLVFSIALLGVFLGTPALAQDQPDMTLNEDLYSELPAESLPTTNPFRFGLENAFYNLQNLFTFNIEKQASLYEWRLHQLDRKASACAQIADDQCLQSIEVRKEKLEEKTESYIEKHEEIREARLERFEAWRQEREQHWQEVRDAVEENRLFREQLMEQRRDMRQEALEQRLQKQEQLEECAENCFRNQERLYGSSPAPESIGGQTDEYGCLTGAGYSWCAEKGECLRAWEESCSSEEQEVNPSSNSFNNKPSTSTNSVNPSQSTGTNSGRGNSNQ